jgi:hypothetical protein
VRVRLSLMAGGVEGIDKRRVDSRKGEVDR